VGTTTVCSTGGHCVEFKKDKLIRREAWQVSRILWGMKALREQAGRREVGINEGNVIVNLRAEVN